MHLSNGSYLCLTTVWNFCTEKMIICIGERSVKWWWSFRPSMLNRRFLWFAPFQSKIFSDFWPPIGLPHLTPLLKSKLQLSIIPNFHPGILRIPKSSAFSWGKLTWKPTNPIWVTLPQGSNLFNTKLNSFQNKHKIIRNLSTKFLLFKKAVKLVQLLRVSGTHLDQIVVPRNFQKTNDPRVHHLPQFLSSMKKKDSCSASGKPPASPVTCRKRSKTGETVTPLEMNGWNMSSWRFGSDHVPFLNGWFCRFHLKSSRVKILQSWIFWLKFQHVLGYVYIYIYIYPFK